LATFPARGEVSARPGRPLPQDLWEPSWFRDSAESQSNTASGKGPVLGLHLRPGGGPNTRYLCTFPVRGELACRECSDH
ncbi:hypothetical protein T4D_11724, partial [Trichinella pseudospiralis]